MPKTRRSRQPQRSRRVTRRTPIDSPDGGTQIETVSTTSRGTSRRVERRTPISTGGSQFEVTQEDTPASDPRQGRSIKSFSPTRAGDKAGGVALLEAEFIGCLFLLVLLLFADTSKSYGDKIMSTLKRGTLISILFFILALVSGIGPNANKIAKAIGGLVFVAILLTSPVTAMVGNFDKFLKQDWVGTGEHGTDVGSSSTSPPASSTGSGGGPLQAAEGAIERLNQLMNTFGLGLIK